MIANGSVGSCYDAQYKFASGERVAMLGRSLGHKSQSMLFRGESELGRKSRFGESRTDALLHSKEVVLASNNPPLFISNMSLIRIRTDFLP